MASAKLKKAQALTAKVDAAKPSTPQEFMAVARDAGEAFDLWTDIKNDTGEDGLSAAVNASRMDNMCTVMEKKARGPNPNAGLGQMSAGIGKTVKKWAAK